MAATNGTESVAVFARLRPVDAGQERGAIIASRSKVQMRDLEFEVGVFEEDQMQADVYARVAEERVAAVLNGFNATILAYGQTGSGKTHTM